MLVLYSEIRIKLHLWTAPVFNPKRRH